MRKSGHKTFAELVVEDLQKLAPLKANVGLWDGQCERYPFIHLGGEEQLWDKFLAQGNSSGQGGIRTRDLSIPKPASYH
ncbi:hypothetical protein DPMN_120648 [Dreissena polymorpha]|uniref:Uncharacterized protein n=1 Tax=Dreissena polymorpha TaxID=45954 RepID=A0A9D4GP82_DREPO|nr:hypothetical protein DPMN_120577 [Dreissena polymorpha]KAH3818920.1 hypothetical protein DPMN_120648 [Dreissena polymorpha]